MDYKNSWEFFKYKVRSNAIKRSKELKKIKTEKELDLEYIMSLTNLTVEKELELKEIQTKLDDFYLQLAEGQKKNFFALEKRNYTNKLLSTLNINGVLSQDPSQISKYVNSFFENIST